MICIIFRYSRNVSPLNLPYYLNSWWFSSSMLMAQKIYECLCEHVTLTIGLLLSFIQTRLTRESWKKNDSSVDIIVKLSGSCSCCLSTKICSVFLKASSSSLDAVLTCTFLGTFCLKPHLRSMGYMCEYNDIWYRFSLWLTLPLLVSWSNLCCFLLAWFLYCRYRLLITPMMVYLSLAYSLIILNLLSRIFLTKHKPMLYFYADLWLHEQISCLDKLN